jgi:hypothetical protein
VRDPVEPRAQVTDLGPGPQRRPRVDERRLDDVLGERVRQQPAQVAQERAPVALDDRLEGAVVAGGGELDEAVVGLPAEQAG